MGDRLLTGGDPKAESTLKDLPPLAVAKDDGPWMVGDLVRSRRGPERFGAKDTDVHFAYDPAAEAPGYHSTAEDGLPDAWKTDRIKPGGLDLAAMGCKVGHRGLIVEIERFENVDSNDLRANVDRAARYFASIPSVNPDGTTGIAHMMFAERDGPLDAAIDGGHYARHRMTLLGRDEGPKPPEGRIDQLSGGVGDDPYITMDTPSLDFYHGWLHHRYKGPNFTSRSAKRRGAVGGPPWSIPLVGVERP